MVDPNVLRNCGIDPEEYTGFAFGFGIDRMAADAPRHRRPPRCSPTTSASWRSSDAACVPVLAPATSRRVGADVDALADALNKLGLDVEDVERVGAPVDGVIVARVAAHARPPRRRQVQLVDVDAGDGEALPVVCGALNIAAGDLVPLATLGTTMPDGFEIERRKIRGEWSNGMLCSARELGLGDDHAGILLLPADARRSAGRVRDVLGLARRRVRPRRHPQPPRRMVHRRRRPRPRRALRPAVRRSDAGASCRRRPERRAAVDDRGARPVRPVHGHRDHRRARGAVARRGWPSRLQLAGMRPINNVVDVTNYVMLERGQPLHAFDLGRSPGGGFLVRLAATGEKLTTLDGVERALDRRRPADLRRRATRRRASPGSWAARRREVDDATTEVPLEMAYFEPVGIATTSTRLGLRSEASARFERGVDPTVTDRADRPLRGAARARPAGGLGGRPALVDARGDRSRPAAVRVRPERVNALLGTDARGGRHRRALEPIGFAVDRTATSRVTVPSWRPDCTVEIDIVEEVARHYGYERLGKTVPTSTHPGPT